MAEYLERIQEQYLQDREQQADGLLTAHGAPFGKQLACAAVVMTMLETAATAAPRPSCPAIWRRVLPVRMSGGRAISSTSSFDLFSRCSASQTARSSSPSAAAILATDVSPSHSRQTLAANSFRQVAAWRPIS